MSDDDHPITDAITILGPVGIWPFKYRVQIRDVSYYDGPAEWHVCLQRRHYANWQTVNVFADDVSDVPCTNLYAEGRSRGGTIPDRTRPSAVERNEQMAAHRAVWGCECGLDPTETE